MPTTAHIIYIPAMLMLGMVLGYVFGSRATRDVLLADQARKEARAARRAAQAKLADAAPPEKSLPPPPPGDQHPQT